MRCPQRQVSQASGLHRPEFGCETLRVDDTGERKPTVTDGLYVGVEAGGTKFVCAVGRGTGEILASERLETTTPRVTIDAVRRFIGAYPGIRGIGIASFGPVDLKPGSPSYGFITSTPKDGWRDVDLVGEVGTGFGVPVAFETDFNSAAIAEQRWGAAAGTDVSAFVIVGTGVGAGLVVGNDVVHGAQHPEFGHVRIPRSPKELPNFAGVCPFHGDCLEGLASGTSIAARWGVPAEQLGADHLAWELEAEYVGTALANLICTVSPQRITLGGGVMDQLHLVPALRHRVVELLGTYLTGVDFGSQRFMGPSELGGDAGVLGALALAERVATELPRPTPETRR